MAPNTPVNLYKLIKEYRIQFDTQGHPDSWPDSHRQTFADIKELGKKEYQVYSETVDVESDLKPWRAQIKTRAKRISGLANNCRNSRKNEAGWRLNVEPEVLARFTIEVNW